MQNFAIGDGQTSPQRKPRPFIYLGLFPVLLLLALIIGFQLLPPSLVIFEPHFLLPVFNTALFLASSVIAYIAMRAYLLSGAAAILWLGCGVLTLGTGALAAGWLIYPYGANVNVTIFNVAVLLASICHAAGVLASLEERPGVAGPAHRRQRAAWGYLAALAAVALLVTLTLSGKTPQFFIQGKGPTILRQYVVEWAIVLFSFSALVIMQRFFRRRIPFLYWYSLALALVALAMAAFLLQPAVGSPIGWVGRSSYLAAAIYFLVAVNAALRQARTRGAGLQEMVAELLAPGLLWEEILSSVSDAVVSHDDQDKIVLWNKAAEQIFGYRESEARGQGLELILLDAQPLSPYGFNGGVTEMELKKRDGSGFSAEVSLSRKESFLGKITTLIIRDISPRKFAEKVLIQAKEEWERTFDAVPDLIMILDNQHRILRANQAMAAACALTPPEMVGRVCHEIMHHCGAPPSVCPHARLLRDGREHVAELRERGRDFLVTATPLTDGQGRVWGSVHVARDITARKRAEEALRRLNEELEQRVKERTRELMETVDQLAEEVTARTEAEEEVRTLNLELEQRVKERTAQLEAANRELESFSYSVSHDLKSPLRAIHGFSRMLQDEHTGGLDAEGRRLLGVVQDNALKMNTLIDDLLTLSRLGRQALRRGRVDMPGIIASVIEELKESCAGRSVEWRVQSLPLAQADRSLIRQVWLNLLANALKFTRPREQAMIEVGCRQEENENVFYVKDNGVGFDMKYADRLFGVFQRLHPPAAFEGTGVGLSLVQRVIQKHGGRVWAEGKVDGGATFYFSLPRKG